MSETKHTPGEWEVSRETAIDYRPNCIVGADGGSLVAWCAGGGPKRAIMGPEEDANARLISAAPDMLEALRECESIAKQAEIFATGRSPSLDPTERWIMIQDTARAAIAKATGEAS